MDRPTRPAPLPRRRPWVVAAPAAVLVALASTPAAGQDPLLWGGLKPGPYAVGYRALYQLDHTRQYDPEFTTDPAQPPAHRPRPILICAWYPARKTGAAPMEYRQYLDVPADDARLAPFVKRLTYKIRVVVSEQTVGKPPTKRTPAETAAFDRLLATNTFAVKDAPAAEGRFPVVISHPGLGGTPDDNSVLFEYLVTSQRLDQVHRQQLGVAVRDAGREVALDRVALPRPGRLGLAGGAPAATVHHRRPGGRPRRAAGPAPGGPLRHRRDGPRDPGAAALRGADPQGVGPGPRPVPDGGPPPLHPRPGPAPGPPGARPGLLR
jgi:hypothetical protein